MSAKKVKKATKKAPPKKAATKKAPPSAKKGKSAPSKKAPPKKAVKKAKAAPRSKPAFSWLDAQTQAPQIAQKAQQLESFLAAIADGVIDEAEVKAQEERLVRVMREVEPLLDAELHAKVTDLLCELTAYDLMQVMHSFHQAKPRSEFQG
jgi:chemotaxis protein histidine kinase CheA